MVVFGKLGGLDGQSVEVESISCPGKESNQEVQPVLPAKLGEKADGVLERLWPLPLAVLLAIVVCDDYALVPGEEVLQTLFGSGDDALGQRVSRTVCGRHDLED